ncbi:MAG: thiolase family protein [Thermoleophilia bacterium]|nr:thiolase family protein [Thermoleophilia bacterium]
MQDAVIVEALRTPVGRRRGSLAGWHPVDLAAEVVRALVERSGIDPASIDDVIVGCVDQVGEQAVNVARSIALAAGLPETVPATTVDRQCGSSQQAAHFAAQGVMAGAYDIVIAAGVESMTRVPMFSNAPDRSEVYGPRFRARYGLAGDAFIEQGLSGEIVAERWGVTRAEMDRFAAASHRRALRATEEGRFAGEIVPITVTDADGAEGVMDRDEGIRPATTEEALAVLAPVFREDGLLTAGNSSQISDGAAALLIMSAARARDLGLRPRARFHAFALAGVDPVEMLSAPMPATRAVLRRGGLSLPDIDLYEVNEAFASVPLAWLADLAGEGADPERLNVNGGAIALGHPLGATGARLMTSLVGEMERSGARYGLQAMCEGGGMANATILERC